MGASATVVGLVAGLGELIGYGLRLITGYISDQTRQYWKITTLGYFINTAVVPLLALAGSWPIAACLIIAERTGKAIRTPARFETVTLEMKGEGLPRVFLIYLAAVALVGAGYADFPLIAYHFHKNSISDSAIPLLYALAMGIDAIAALIFGRLFDRRGISILIIAVFCRYCLRP